MGKSYYIAGSFLKAAELAQPYGLVIPFIENSAELEILVETFSRHNRFCAALNPKIKEYLNSFLPVSVGR